MEYSFNCFNKLGATGITMALHNFLSDFSDPPVLLCIGSDLAIGDSLGPITGTLTGQKNLRRLLYLRHAHQADHGERGKIFKCLSS